MSTINGTAGDDELGGTSGGDTINGLAGDDILYGAAGNDTLNGGDGNDFLEGGTGNDKVDGGTGFNFATYTLTTAGVHVSLAITTAQDTGVDGTDTLINIQGLIGSAFNDTLTGDANSNILDGGAGMDALMGAAGDDIIEVSTPTDAVAGETYDGGSGHDQFVLAQGVYDFSQSSVVNFEELDGAGSQLTMALADLTSFTKIEAATLTIAGGGTIGFAGVELDLTQIKLAAPTALDISGATGGLLIATGSPGNDTIVGNNAGDTLSGGAGDDTVTGGSGNDFLHGNAGNDTVSGGAGNDWIWGDTDGTTNDTDKGVDTLSGGAGDDHIATGAGGGTATGDDGNDTLTGTHGASLDGGTGDDFIMIGAAASVTGGAGDDTIEAVLTSDFVAGQHISGGSGNDTLVLGDPTVIYDLTGVTFSHDIETISGASARMTAGELAIFPNLDITNAYVHGAGTADLGADVSLPTDFTIETAKVVLDLTGFAGHAVTVNVADVTSNVTGTVLGDTLNGGAVGDILNGDAGDDQIAGGGGNDTLSGGVGMDHIDAGDGNDMVSGGDDADTLLGGTGSDTLNGDAGDDVLQGGDGNDVLNGGDGNDTITGGAGRDAIDGGAGDDTVFMDTVGNDPAKESYKGGDGFDTLVVSNDRDISHVSISGFEKLDTTDMERLTVLPSQLDGFTTFTQNFTFDFAAGGTLSGLMSTTSVLLTFNFSASSTVLSAVPGGNSTAIFAVNGGAGNDHVTGGDEIDQILGGAGNDVLDGGNGNDAITGGPGRDTIDGGAGDDTVTVFAGDAVAHEIYSGGDGTDILSAIGPNVDLSPVSFSGFETLEDFYDHLTISASQLLEFQKILAPDIFLTTGGTVDLSQPSMLYSGGALTLSDHATTVLLPTTMFLAIGLDVTGGAGNDAISGGYAQLSAYLGMGGNDVLTFASLAFGTLDGGDGNDVLTGGLKKDTILGGAGDDLIHVSASDTIDGGAGSDTMAFDLATAAVSVDLSKLAATGALHPSFTAIENVTGSAFADKLTGDAGANVLNGGAGDDVLVGGAGIDTLTGGAGKDTFYFAAGDLDGTSTTTAERITDFTQADGDVIDLHKIDAIVGGGDNPFAFIGAAAFGHHAGELRYQFSGTHTTFVMGDIDGDGAADFVIRLDGHVTLTAADFLL